MKTENLVQIICSILSLIFWISVMVLLVIFADNHVKLDSFPYVTDEYLRKILQTISPVVAINILLILKMWKTRKPSYQPQYFEWDIEPDMDDDPQRKKK